MKNIDWIIKPFNELSIQELYQMMQLRSLVFVVEQNCVYQDLDGKDQKALHLMGKINNKIVAYARLFNAGDYFENASIGRVVVNPNFRAMKLGINLMKNAISGVETHYNQNKITISAQLYLKKFYENLGFVQVSDVYLEDDIEHIEMLKSATL